MQEPGQGTGLSLAVTRGGPDVKQFLSQTHQAASGPWFHVAVLRQLPQHHYKVQGIRFSPGKGKRQRPRLQSPRVTGPGPLRNESLMPLKHLSPLLGLSAPHAFYVPNHSLNGSSTRPSA